MSSSALLIIMLYPAAQFRTVVCLGLRTNPSNVLDIVLSSGKPSGRGGADHLEQLSCMSLRSAQLCKQSCINRFAAGLKCVHFIRAVRASIPPAPVGLPAVPKKCFIHARDDCSSKEIPGERSVSKLSNLFNRSHSRVSASQCREIPLIETRSAPTKMPARAATSKLSEKSFSLSLH